MRTQNLINFVQNGGADKKLQLLYGKDQKLLGEQKKRYLNLLKKHHEQFGNAEKTIIISAPGRVELLGNHTDHNHGKVMAASINQDTVAVVTPRGDLQVHLFSQGYRPIRLDFNNLKPVAKENGRTAALIRGVAAKMDMLGYHIGGFNATAISDVLSGSGMSSSAAFEVLICAILDKLYNGFIISATQRAQISQYAENNYFMKPSGLMDQLACSTGGLVAIDFKEKEPVVTPVAFDFEDYGYAMLIVNTFGSHGGLTDQYAAIPEEMRRVAAHFSQENLRGLTLNRLLENIPALRQKVSDRAILRAIHFLEENDRVDDALHAVERKDIEAFFEATRASGQSSISLLQNIYLPDSCEQPLLLSQVFVDRLLQGKGASRIHGGGFAGTSLHYVPLEKLESVSQQVNAVFGEEAGLHVRVRPVGAAVVAE
jgi:galactokinase